MSSALPLPNLKRDLASLKGRWVILYGSQVSGYATPRSDIDIAVITKKTNPEENKRIWLQLLGTVPEKYDLKVFELLPLDVKAGIMDNHKIVWGNELDIREYLYHFRKLWKDVRPRYLANQFTSVSEKMKVLERVAVPYSK